MSRSSGRGQAEPLAALVAVGAVCLSLSLYAGVLDASLPGSSERDVAAATIDPVHDRLAPDGVVRPDRLAADRLPVPAGYDANVTVVADGRRWSVGPALPAAADTARRRVTVRVGPAGLRSGVLRVRLRR